MVARASGRKTSSGLPAPAFEQSHLFLLGLLQLQNITVYYKYFLNCAFSNCLQLRVPPNRMWMATCHGHSADAFAAKAWKKKKSFRLQVFVTLIVKQREKLRDPDVNEQASRMQLDFPSPLARHLCTIKYQCLTKNQF